MSMLEELKAQSRVSLDRSFSLKSYLNSARKVYAEATVADGAHDVAGAYVGFRKYAQLLQVILAHPGHYPR
jgi:hypothetical protein